MQKRFNQPERISTVRKQDAVNREKVMQVSVRERGETETAEVSMRGHQGVVGGTTRGSTGGSRETKPGSSPQLRHRPRPKVTGKEKVTQRPPPIILQQDTWTVAKATRRRHRRERAGGESKRIPPAVPLPVLLRFKINPPLPKRETSVGIASLALLAPASWP